MSCEWANQLSNFLHYWLTYYSIPPQRKPLVLGSMVPPVPPPSTEWQLRASWAAASLYGKETAPYWIKTLQLMRKAEKTTTDIHQTCCISKATSIVYNPKQSLHTVFTVLPWLLDLTWHNVTWLDSREVCVAVKFILPVLRSDGPFRQCCDGQVPHNCHKVQTALHENSSSGLTHSKLH